MLPVLEGRAAMLAGDRVSMNMVSCNWGLLSLTAILLEIGDARGEGVMMAGESLDGSDEAGEWDKVEKMLISCTNCLKCWLGGEKVKILMCYVQVKYNGI